MRWCTDAVCAKMGIRTVQPRLFIHTCTTIGLTFIADRAEAGGVAAGVAVEVAGEVAVEVAAVEVAVEVAAVEVAVGVAVGAAVA